MASVLEQYLLPIKNLIYSEEYREFLRLFFKYKNTPRKKLINLNCMEYNLDVVDALSFIFQFKHIFVNKMYHFQTSNPQPLIYDCGANVGLSVLYYKKYFPGSRIKAFEADSDIASTLVQNLKRNSIKDVVVVNKAVWIDNNGVDFSADYADGGSIYNEGNKIKVESIRLRDLIASEEKIDLIKINVEGAELDVIPDCDGVLNKADNLYIEYHSFPKMEQKLDVILNVLKRNGFRYYIQNIVSPNAIPSKEQLMAEELDLQLHIFAYKA